MHRRFWLLTLPSADPIVTMLHWDGDLARRSRGTLDKGPVDVDEDDLDKPGTSTPLHYAVA